METNKHQGAEAVDALSKCLQEPSLEADAIKLVQRVCQSTRRIARTTHAITATCTEVGDLSSQEVEHLKHLTDAGTQQVVMQVQMLMKLQTLTQQGRVEQEEDMGDLDTKYVKVCRNCEKAGHVTYECR